jgi:hypothetical protein
MTRTGRRRGTSPPTGRRNDESRQGARQKRASPPPEGGLGRTWAETGAGLETGANPFGCAEPARLSGGGGI